VKGLTQHVVTVGVQNGSKEHEMSTHFNYLLDDLDRDFFQKVAKEQAVSNLPIQSSEIALETVKTASYEPESSFEKIASQLESDLEIIKLSGERGMGMGASRRAGRYMSQYENDPSLSDDEYVQIFDKVAFDMLEADMETARFDLKMASPPEMHDWVDFQLGKVAFEHCQDFLSTFGYLPLGKEAGVMGAAEKLLSKGFGNAERASSMASAASAAAAAERAGAAAAAERAGAAAERRFATRTAKRGIGETGGGIRSKIHSPGARAKTFRVRSALSGNIRGLKSKFHHNRLLANEKNLDRVAANQRRLRALHAAAMESGNAFKIGKLSKHLEVNADRMIERERKISRHAGEFGEAAIPKIDSVSSKSVSSAKEGGKKARNAANEAKGQTGGKHNIDTSSPKNAKETMDRAKSEGWWGSLSETEKKNIAIAAGAGLLAGHVLN